MLIQIVFGFLLLQLDLLLWGLFVLPRTAGHLPHPKEAGPLFRAAYLQPQTGASRIAVL